MCKGFSRDVVSTRLIYTVISIPLMFHHVLLILKCLESCSNIKFDLQRSPNGLICLGRFLQICKATWCVDDVVVVVTIIVAAGNAIIVLRSMLRLSVLFSCKWLSCCCCWKRVP